MSFRLGDSAVAAITTPARCRTGSASNDRSACGTAPSRICRLRFTAAELRVLVRLAAGLTDDAIASSSHLSPHTVRHHVTSAMRRASAQSRTELVAKCFAAGVLAAAWPPALDAERCLCALS